MVNDDDCIWLVLAVGNGPYSPWDSPRLQFVGNVHVPGPDVELPLPEAQNATEHGARVDPNAHVDVVFRTRAHIPERQEPLCFRIQKVERNPEVYSHAETRKGDKTKKEPNKVSRHFHHGKHYGE